MCNCACQRQIKQRKIANIIYLMLIDVTVFAVSPLMTAILVEIQRLSEDEFSA